MPCAAAAVTTNSQAASKIRFGPNACQKAISNSRPGARPRTNRVMITRSRITSIIPCLFGLMDLESTFVAFISGPSSIADVPLEDTIKAADQLLQVDPMLLCKALFSQSMIRIPGFPVVRRTQRYRGEVRRLLPNASGPQGVGVGRFDKGRLAADSRTDYASQRPNPGQIIRASLRTLPRPGSPLAHRHSTFRRHAAPQRSTPP